MDMKLSRIEHTPDFPAVIAARNDNNSIITFQKDNAVALIPDQSASFFTPMKMKKEGDLILFRAFDYMEEEKSLSLLDLISSDTELNSSDTIGEQYNSVTEESLVELVKASEYSPEELLQFILTLLEQFPTIPVFNRTTQVWDRTPLTSELLISLLEILIFESNFRLETILEEMINFDGETIDSLFSSKKPETIIKRFKQACSYESDYSDYECDNADEE